MKTNFKGNAWKSKKAPWRKLKRYLAVTMAALMIAMSAMPGFTMVAFADSTPELQADTTMKDNSAGLTTAYAWKSTGRFDLEGIKDPANINKDGGYTGDRSKGVITTYGHGGYGTVVGKGGNTTNVTIGKNGGVQTLPAPYNVDVQMKVYPSKDHKWILVDYIVCNRTDANNDVKIASGTDVQVGGLSGGGSGDPSDCSTLTWNDVGFHMVNSDLPNGAKGTYESFDLKYKDDDLGLTEPATKWVGHQWDRFSHYFDTSGHSVSNTDSGLTYSWNLSLKPYETQLRRVAFSAKGPAYYVSSANGNDGNTGADNAPLQTIEAAMDKIGSKVGYVYIQDYAPMDKTVTVSPSANITFMSADYDFQSQPTDKVVTLTRKDGFQGPMFQTSGGTMQFGSLVLDGEKRPGSQPLLAADSGKIGLQKGGRLENNSVSEAGKASAIDMTGSASLDMNYGDITGNVSEDGGAVDFNSTGAFTIQNDVNIKGNTDSSGKDANVYLPEGTYISVAGDLGGSEIGVTTARKPEPSANQTSTKPEQEVLVAAPTADYQYAGAAPFLDNFSPDNPGSEGADLYVGEGTNFSQSESGNERNAVLRKNGFQLQFDREVKETGAAVPAAAPLDPMIFGAGDEVDISLEKADPAGSGVAAKYERLNEVRVDPEGALTFTPSADPGSGLIGRLEGRMPGGDVTVTCLYGVADTAISFLPNGGAPAPAPVEGAAGSPNNNLLPSVSRYGYDFAGWSKTNDRADPQWITDASPEWTTFPEGDMDLYAIFQPGNPPLPFDYITQYVNEDGSITFQADKAEKHVEEEITAAFQEVHGYILDKGETVPDQYNYGSPIPGSSDPAITGGQPEAIGRFDASHGFKGYMPAQPATVRYRYKVNRGDDDARSTLTVRHVLEGSGAEVGPDQTSRWFPEDPITAEPLSRYGYECRKGEVTSGTKDAPTLPSPAGPLTGVTGEFNSSHEFNGTMPNQDVVITYTYEATGGYPLAIDYLDDGTNDPALKKLPESTAERVPPESAVDKRYATPYGYQLSGKEMSPTGGKLQFNGDDVEGAMPNDEVSVAYHHDRVPGKWADVTFAYDEAGHGKLARGDGTSEDLHDGQDGKSFHASILISDGTQEGGKSAYTIKQIAEKGLSPIPRADDNYMFDGWFADDVIPNGKLDEGEKFYPKDGADVLSGPATLTAHFIKDPDKWGDVTLKAGDNGSIVKDGVPMDAVTVNVSKGQTWGQIAGQLPQPAPAPAGTPEIKPVANYLAKGWYHDGTPMAQDEALAWGDTYSIEFRKDPASFGTNPATPEAEAGLDGTGRGKATVFDASEGYRYILADPAGTVLAVQNGNSVTSLAFGNLQPGSRYRIYEAPAGSPVSAGDDAAGVAGASSPAEVLIPVVDSTNYQVYYDDEEDGKTVLSIRPADGKSEYALLDADGRVVHAPQAGQSGWQAASGNPGAISFSGLDYDGRYTVVAIPKGAGGIAPEDKLPDGSAITTDPGGDPELPSFIVKTEDSSGGHGGTIRKIVRKTADGSGTEVVPGSEDAACFQDARAGDTVYLDADAEDEDGPFDHWELTIGSAKGVGTTEGSPSLSFEMPASNLVFTAVYKRTATPGNATVTDEVRGGNPGEIALARSEIPGLEDELTTDKDRELSGVNHAPVTYRAVYQKTGVTATDSDAVKAVSGACRDHPGSFKEAWGLDVSLERYVGSRKVNASPSDATFKTYAQLGRDDVDMLDYELYDVTSNPGGTPVPAQWLPDDGANPEATGGLFAFEAQAGHRYVMCYSKAYRVRFKNDTLKSPEGGADFNLAFKVRRGESPSDSCYSDDYGRAEDYAEGLARQFTDGNGVIFTKQGWSYRRDKLAKFDPDRGITRKTTAYMCYKDNAKDVEAARRELEDRIAAILDMSDDHFLKEGESRELKEYAKAAQAVLDREAPHKATQGDLAEAVAKLKEQSGPFEAVLKDRYEDYNHKQENGHKGGSGSGGGGGGGTMRSPFDSTPTAGYRIGTNGNWKKATDPDGKTPRLTFVLNGGMPLRDTWARLEYPGDASMKDEDGAALEGAGWYHFNGDGFMETGWIRDPGGTWYYLNTKKDGYCGRMATGWKLDEADGRWYYLDPASGAMATGWKQIDGKWYYFSPAGGGAYAYDAAKGQWAFGGGTGRPMGSMYKNEVTPDGYAVGPDGAWTQ